MVSLADHDTLEASTAEASTYVNFMDSDETPLVGPGSAAAGLEPPFRIVATSGAIFFQMLSIFSLSVLSLALPPFPDGSSRSPRDAYSVLLYTHTGLWAVMVLVDCYLRRQHSILHCGGYVSFYQRAKILRRATVYTVSAGSSMLVVLAVLVDNYCHDRTAACPPSMVQPIHYVRILFGLEEMTLNFHKNKNSRDAQLDELLLISTHSQSSDSDSSVRDNTYLEGIVEKQSDLIRYLKKCNAFLGRKVVSLSSEVNNLRA